MIPSVLGEIVLGLTLLRQANPVPIKPETKNLSTIKAINDTRVQSISPSNPNDLVEKIQQYSPGAVNPDMQLTISKIRENSRKELTSLLDNSNLLNNSKKQASSVLQAADEALGSRDQCVENTLMTYTALKSLGLPVKPLLVNYLHVALVYETDKGPLYFETTASENPIKPKKDLVRSYGVKQEEMNKGVYMRPLTEKQFLAYFLNSYLAPKLFEKAEVEQNPSLKTRAYKLIDEAFELDPNFYVSQVRKGYADLARGNIENARKLFTLAKEQLDGERPEEFFRAVGE